MNSDRRGENLTLVLQPGEVIRADVLRELEDGRWVLGLMGVEIAFPSTIPLVVGSTITLLAQANPGGNPFLRLVQGVGSAPGRERSSRRRKRKGSGVDVKV